MSGWPNFQARIIKEAQSCLGNSRDGIAIVRPYILINSDGDPLVWVIDPALVVEPKGSAFTTILNYIKKTLDNG